MVFLSKQMVLQLAKGFKGRAKNCNKLARRRVQKSLQNAYIGRRLKKRDFRALWIQRINAGARLYGLSYAPLIHGLNRTSISLNRKMLSELAITEPLSFKAVVEHVKSACPDLPKSEGETDFGLVQSVTVTDTHPGPAPYVLDRVNPYIPLVKQTIVPKPLDDGDEFMSKKRRKEKRAASAAASASTSPPVVPDAVVSSTSSAATA